MVGKCYIDSSGQINAATFLSTTADAQYNFYTGSYGALTPGADEQVSNLGAAATPPAVDFEDPYDGTFAAITNTTGNYITGLVSEGVNLNNSGGCTFAGYTSAS